ncbi:MAG: PspC domain-containing protein [Anaerolineae bacterium]
MKTKLYRSREDSMIAGVCGGLARYLGIDSTLVRLFFVLLVLGEGMGVLLYVILWLIMPPAEKVEESTIEGNIRTGAGEMADKAREVGASLRSTARRPDHNTAIIIGGALIILGLVFLLDNLNVSWLWWLEFDILWPALLVLGGIVVLIRALRGG